MILFDNHMHTRFSGDSEADELQMIEAAQKAGLSGITFTDHLDWDYGMEPHLFDLDLPSYAERMHQLRQMYNGRDGFTVRFGIEIGLQPHLAAEHEKLIREYDFDSVIGSVHQVEGIDPYYPAYFSRYPGEAGLRRYYEAVLENLKAWHGFDTLGHLDYILRYVPEEQCAGLDESACDDLIDEILRTLIAYNIALEVNTGGLRSKLRETNPSPRILERYRYLGGKRISIGSDAHRPEDVATGFAQTFQMLEKLGMDPHI